MNQHRFFAVLAIFLLSGFCAQSQDTTLQKILAAPDDTNKVKKLISHGRTYFDIDNKKAESIFRSIIPISEKLLYQAGTAELWHCIGYVNANAGKFNESISDFRKSIALYSKLNNVVLASKGLSNLGSIYEMLGKPDSSMYFYLQAVKILEHTDHTSDLARPYGGMGVLYGNNKQFDKAIYYKTKALDILRKSTDTVQLIEALTELGDTFGDTGNFQKANELAYEALQLTGGKANRSMLSTVYYSLSASLLGLNKVDSAIVIARMCMSNALQAGDINTYMGGALCLSDAYHLLGNQKERLGVLKIALKQRDNQNLVIILDDFYERMADASYRMNRYKDAYDYNVLYNIYKDSVLNDRNNKTVAELEIKYQTAEKEKKISEKQLQIINKDLELQKSRQYIIYSIGATLLAFLTAGFFYIDFRNKRKFHNRQLYTIKQEKEIQLLQALMQGEEKERSRIAKDLHDGVAGMLAAVKMHFSSLSVRHTNLQTENEFHQGVRLLDEACLEIRKTSHNLMPEVLMMYGLDEALRRYCSNIRNSRLNVQYDSWGEEKRFKGSFELSVYRVVQELLNNIIKHSKADNAIVQMSLNGHLLSITVEDNGTGIKNEQGKDGMGIRSLQSRVKAMNGKIELLSEEGGGVSAYLEFDTIGLEE